MKIWPIPWCRRLWMAMSLHGRLVAGYTALFAILLIGIAFGETTVVRQVLIDDRKAALPAATSDLNAILKVPFGDNRPGLAGPILRGPAGDNQLGFAGSIRVVSGDAAQVLAVFSSDGTVLYKKNGSGVANVDPKQLLDTRYFGGDPTVPTTYQRNVGPTAYIVQVHSMPLPAMAVSTDQPPDAGAISAPSTPLTMKSVTVLVAESLRPVDDTVNALLLITLAASGLGLLLAATAGLAVARRALRPLDRMTATAQAIAAGGDRALDRRLNLPGRGDEIGRLATTFDHMLDRIQATIAERVRSETRLRQFAADASHELRTPLAAMSGYTEVLLMGGKDDPETAVHALRQMDRELGRMNRLVADLLTLARLEAGLPLHTQALPVDPLLDGLAEETRLLAARAGRDLAIAIASPPAGADVLTVRADPDRLHQILLNLLHNAVKFTPNGGRITLHAARRNGTVAISVTDTGTGIAAEELPLLFERFYRSDQARARGDGADAGGAGLGLAIAQGLAQAQRGHIEVASTSGSGSTFTVILPCT